VAKAIALDVGRPGGICNVLGVTSELETSCCETLQNLAIGVGIGIKLLLTTLTTRTKSARRPIVNAAHFDKGQSHDPCYTVKEPVFAPRNTFCARLALRRCSDLFRCRAGHVCEG
jgi:hypothetical protein